jgi:hypothetical protein
VDYEEIMDEQINADQNFELDLNLQTEKGEELLHRLLKYEMPSIDRICIHRPGVPESPLHDLIHSFMLNSFPPKLNKFQLLGPKEGAYRAR